MEGPVLGCLLFATLYGLAWGLQTGPPYSYFGRPCNRDSQCSRELGEVCWWLYNGCESGQCMCPPSTHTQDKNGRCVPAYGFSNQDVQCGDTGQCECNPGFKREHQTCRRLLIGEWGCSQAFHCGGGAICVDGYCQCPNGYKPIASRTKCAKIGALSELPVGRRCDENNEERYCAKGLVCHSCFGQSLHTCVRYHQTEALHPSCDFDYFSTFQIDKTAQGCEGFLFSTVKPPWSRD
ncbi:hypothetical protein CAPTEDRAFT_219742 [Capitella teleta]|uniref:EB domain-containing protein n=1 Tax=Capitella teleta TaxID=283909 RepID=R7ULY5_CAPTE|nr:hypothetical protein CAPTEDRAFT_219742 [Capitella teleta]|eukprot:ELU07539.1 hypothetical protein CAPTEDRAFT_219742 [Capitella teleta]